MTSTPELSDRPASNHTVATLKPAPSQEISATQGSNPTAAAAGRSSYAAATRHSLPPNASTGNKMATAIEGSAPSKPSLEEPMKPVNGNVPVVSAAAAIPPFTTSAGIDGANVVPSGLPSTGDANSSASASTIRTNGGVLPAGPPNKAINFQFGEVTTGSSPASGPSPALASPSPANLGVAGAVQPRPISPQTSPSPVPRPVISGGRPPSSLQNHSNPFVFGQSGPEVTDQMGHLRATSSNSSLPPAPHAPDIRRASSHSSHGDMPPLALPAGPARGGGHTMPATRGGRANFHGQQYPPQMNYPMQTNYRGGTNQRGMHGGPYPGRPHPYPSSPNLASRSPAMMNAHPAPPPMPHMSHMPMVPGVPGQQYVYPGHSGYPQQGFPPLQFQSDPSLQAFYNSGAMPSGQPAHAPYPPVASPHPSYATGAGPQPVPSAYSNPPHPSPNAPSMSRTSSQVSTVDRPPSNAGQQPTPAPASSANSTGRPATSSPAPKSNFILPPRKSAALVIKNAEGVVQPVKTRAPGSPSRATPSPVKGGTSPASLSRSRSVSTAGASHARTDSANDKSGEEKRKAMQDAVAKKIAEDAKLQQETEPSNSAAPEKSAVPSEKDNVLPKATAPTTSANPSAKPDPSAKSIERGDNDAAGNPPAASDDSNGAAEQRTASDKGQPDEEDEFEAMVKQMEAEEAAREKEEAEKEAKYQAKKQAEKEAQKQQQAEEEAAYLANLKQAERQAEEAEEARERERGRERTADGVAPPADEVGSKVAAPEPVEAPPAPAKGPANPRPAVSSPPGPDTSMAPPPGKASAAGRRDKPGALTLETTKAVEPPQPSAGMKSLQAARFLQDPSRVEYPSSIDPPSPALNVNVPADRKFKYNKEFLLQFQKVFKEKPSMDWDARIRDTVGDGGDGSARPPSARTPAPIGARSNSRVNVPQGYSAFAPFGAPPARQNSANMAAGMPSAERFPVPSQPTAPPRGGPIPNNPFAFGRPQGISPGGSISRSGSSTALGGSMPVPMPRPGGSQRGNTRNGSKRDKATARKIEEENNKMPMTASIEVKPIHISSGGWKPRSLTQAAGAGPAPDGHMAPDMVQRKVKGLLNKMTPEKFERISDQILEIAGQSKNETDGRTLRQIIQLTFEKATDEAHWASTYALFCERMLKFMSPDIKDQNIKDKHGNVVTGGALFRKYLLNRCQEEFERGWKVNMPGKVEGQTEEAALMSDEYYIAAAAKRRGLGLVKFIGEVYKLGMLNERIMHECVKKLLDLDESGVDESEVESLVSLLNTVGLNLEQSEKGPAMMNAYFERIVSIMNHPGLQSRLKYKLLDVIDLRKRGWRSKNDDKGPKTIAQIHADAQRQQQEAEVERLRQQHSNRGGGGRLAMGRGDARNFSGGHGMPPPDLTANNVGSDDLRRLGARAIRNSSNSGGPSLGPTSLLSSGRTNSSRRGPGLGPTSMLSREDSGASSRMGTPPQQQAQSQQSSSQPPQSSSQQEKEKKKDGDKSSTNTFSALASLEADSANQAASPPSATSSPPTTKLRPAVEQGAKPSDKSKP